LKPAHEPIVVARKPLHGTVVNNVLKWGTGAINVGKCMVETGDNRDRIGGGSKGNGGCYGESKTYDYIGASAGRWPANVIHDGSDEVLAEFEKFGPVGSWSDNPGRKSGEIFGAWGRQKKSPFKGKTGSAARFFYCAKASPAERNLGCEKLTKRGGPETFDPKYRDGVASERMPLRGNRHPTVKPLALMRYLVRLVTPPGGTVLDPFMGSGSTLIGAAKEGFDSVGIDKEAAYIEISRKRIMGQLGILVEIV